ncbi:hypothetical protein BDP27DRAFT_1326633 [Rhodocollybia butyracea]|uniref:F-box domain-containing protein n=1 Tax=Rhodocollybia butyracea TaxID=206335 RepID=A0A9P5U8B8_9AGAR|nr:hypothetical protein BDP27DRAFT_1326633 [Rhodocollybia butyracea]
MGIRALVKQVKRTILPSKRTHKQPLATSGAITSEANVPPHRLDSKGLTSSHYPTYSPLESAYQALYTELFAKSRHNDIPDSPVARDRLRAQIAQTLSDLQTCSENTIRSQISRVLKLQESLLAPIRTLPSDVLTEIIQSVLELNNFDGIGYLSWHATKLFGGIFPLTWVCFWWRDQALSHSAFWSHTTVHYDSLHAVPTTEVFAFLTECILRSGVSVPMTVKISLRGDESPPAVITMFMTMLVARAHRWRQAELRFGSLKLIDNLFPFESSPTKFPLLADLTFDYDEVELDSSLQNPILECRPPLQRLKLTQLSESHTDVIASRNLKVLEVGCYIGVSLARLLHVCPCLEFLDLSSFKSIGNPDANQIPCHSSLLSLEIHGDIVNGPWKCVTLPKLTQLRVRLPKLGHPEEPLEEAVELDVQASLNELKEVLKRSGCTLQHVNLFPSSYWSFGWPIAVVAMVVKFFEELPAEAEGCFVIDMPLQEWKEQYLE